MKIELTEEQKEYILDLISVTDMSDSQFFEIQNELEKIVVISKLSKICQNDKSSKHIN